MREIEIKARISSVESIVDLLTRQGVSVSEPVTQHDRVYGLPGIEGDDENTAPWLRIRTEIKGDTTKSIFTLKRSVTNQMDSIEHETEVSDDVELEKIITQLSFVPYTNLTKTRQKAKLTDIEICLDTVDGLGTFIEAEKLTADDVDYQGVIDELWVIFETLGISRTDQVTDGYDVLMNKKFAATA
ncbi:MAG TPA: class IV adenylate cyclase [Candidatus Saccharimonadales bacterium]